MKQSISSDRLSSTVYSHRKVKEMERNLLIPFTRKRLAALQQHHSMSYPRRFCRAVQGDPQKHW